eukprot:6265037-Prymnesium_polylepis.1
MMPAIPLPPVSPSDRLDVRGLDRWQGESCTSTMFLPLGTAPDAVKMIRDAVEASQEHQRVNGLF